MTSVAFQETNQRIEELSGLFHSSDLYKSEGHKSVSVMKNVIVVTTDNKSLDNAKEILSFLTNIKENMLPTKALTSNSYTICQQNYENITENLLKVNKLFSVIDGIFETNKEEDSFVIDDENMSAFLDTMKMVKHSLEFISDYLSLTMQVYKAKEEIETGKATILTAIELSEIINAA